MPWTSETLHVVSTENRDVTGDDDVRSDTSDTGNSGKSGGLCTEHRDVISFEKYDVIDGWKRDGTKHGGGDGVYVT